MHLSTTIFAAAWVSLVLAGCAKSPPTLPADPIDKAAACGVVTAATERQRAGVKGELPADAQARIFHYALLAGSQGPRFDNDRADAVFKRMPQLFDSTIKGKWPALQPECASAFPEAQIGHPKLPTSSLDGVLQCYVLTDFMRKALGDQGAAYTEAVVKYGALTQRLDVKMAPMLKQAGIGNGPEWQARRAEALTVAAKLGQPPAVIAACDAKYR